MTIDEIRDNFALLDDWDDRYRYVIELGRTLEPMSDAEHSAVNKVQGCTSQVWLSLRIARDADSAPVLTYVGDSDAHIVRGLVAILLTLYSGRKPKPFSIPTRSPSLTNLVLRTSHAAALQRAARHGRAHPQGRAGSGRRRGLTIYPSTHLPIYPSTHLPIYPSTHLPIYPSTHLPIYPSTHLPIYPSTHLPARKGCVAREPRPYVRARFCPRVARQAVVPG